MRPQGWELNLADESVTHLQDGGLIVKMPKNMQPSMPAVNECKDTEGCWTAKSPVVWNTNAKEVATH